VIFFSLPAFSAGSGTGTVAGAGTKGAEGVIADFVTFLAFFSTSMSCLDFKRRFLSPGAAMRLFLSSSSKSLSSSSSTIIGLEELDLDLLWMRR
jgi:hypothetical protein